jgi:hypothetical protein
MTGNPANNAIYTGGFRRSKKTYLGFPRFDFGFKGNARFIIVVERQSDLLTLLEQNPFMFIAAFIDEAKRNAFARLDTPGIGVNE